LDSDKLREMRAKGNFRVGKERAKREQRGRWEGPNKLEWVRGGCVL